MIHMIENENKRTQCVNKMRDCCIVCVKYGVIALKQRTSVIPVDHFRLIWFIAIAAAVVVFVLDVFQLPSTSATEIALLLQRIIKIFSAWNPFLLSVHITFYLWLNIN